MYIYNEYRNSLVVDQYISSELNILEGEQGLKLNQLSEFPEKGYSKINILQSNNKKSYIYFRIPSWDKNMKIFINNKKIKYEISKGYAKIK